MFSALDWNDNIVGFSAANLHLINRGTRFAPPKKKWIDRYFFVPGDKQPTREMTASAHLYNWLHTLATK